MRLLLAAAGAALMLAAPALAHKGNPNFLSEIAGVTPAAEGVRLEMINRDDRILLENRSGKDITVLGYEGDVPYARIDADGTVSVNTNSEAYYLNEDRFGTTDVPETLPEEPEWKTLSGTGRFEWHDHRAHWMGRDRPPMVKDPEQRTKVFDWEVPIEVDGRPAAITGTLFWTPLPGGGAPVGAIIAGAAIVIGLCVAVVVVRRRRAGGGGASTAAPDEAWG